MVIRTGRKSGYDVSALVTAAIAASTTGISQREQHGAVGQKFTACGNVLKN